MITIAMMAGATTQTRAGADEPEGRTLYEQSCAHCHGESGEGVADLYDQQLAGDKSVGQLTRYIAESMPEDDPESVVGEQARTVAAYIHDAFYSELARERLRPATIELARLTNRQYQQSIADLIGQFESFGWPDDRRGLDADYYNDKSFRREKRVIERIDPKVDFDYGESTPDPEQIEQEEFSIRWRGGVIPPETGEYEFIVETENAARLSVNNVELIDAWVRSGDDTEFRGRIRLLGGRLYPLQLEYRSIKEKTASIRLRWKPPHLAEQVIPERLLTPDRTGRVFVVTTPFPPDDRSMGYERGTSISRTWYEATTQAALEVAAYVADNRHRLAGLGRDDDQEQRDEKFRMFARTFVERAFRRPLSKVEQQAYLDRQFAEADSPEDAVKRIVILALSSPRFLYRQAGQAGFDDFSVASWLSFALWDSLPDEAAWQAAINHQLADEEAIAAQARRMVDDPRTKAKMRLFLHQWLNVDRFGELAKDSQRFPDFDEAMISDLRTSLDLFLDEVVWSEASGFRQLLLDESLYLNEGLAAYYGAEVPGAAFEKVSLADQGRAGVLSHPYLMAGFAYDETTSPIHRGVFLARSLLGRTLKPPPEAVVPTPPELAPDLTTRERILAQTEPAACQTCHRMINPLGFSMEHFDAVGRYRTDEQDRPIDATGSYVTRDGDEVTFRGVRELAQFLAASPESQEAFVEQLFQVMIKQPVRAFGPDMLEELRASFEEHDFSIRQLLVEIATRSAIEARRLRSDS